VAALTALVDRVTRRLRTARRVCRTVVLRLRFADYTRATRSYTMRDATSHTHTILTTALGLLRLSEPTIERRGLTLVGVALTNLSDHGAVQLALPFDRTRELDAVLDRIRDRYGSRAIDRAVLIGRDPGTWVPLLPD
jgi:DNA polymerase-4